MTLDELVLAFRQGRVIAPAGPVRPEAVRITRRSLLVTTRGTVLKLRRPRAVDGWDQTSDPVRAALAIREHAIGSRMSPEIYLDLVQLLSVAAVADAAAVPGADTPELANTFVLQVGTDLGEPVIAMTRLPDALRADHVLVTQDPPAAAFLAVAQRIANFHDFAPAHWGDDGPGAPGRALASWDSAITRLQSDPDVPATAAELARLDAHTRELLGHIARPLAHRVLEGRIREGHGGLALEHLFLTDPPAFLDPADASDGAGFVDTAEDIARLALELYAVAGTTFTDRFLDLYAGLARDMTLRRVLPFYLRLAAIRAAQDALDEARDSDGTADPIACREAARFFITQAFATP